MWDWVSMHGQMLMEFCILYLLSQHLVCCCVGVQGGTNQFINQATEGNHPPDSLADTRQRRLTQEHFTRNNEGSMDVDPVLISNYVHP